MTPFHGEKGTTWEGGFRIPMLVRWPGVIKPGTEYNDIISLMDWFPTLAAAAGEPNIKEKMAQGFVANGKEFKVHLDGYNFMPYFEGEGKCRTAGFRSTTLTKAEISTRFGGTIGNLTLLSTAPAISPPPLARLPALGAHHQFANGPVTSEARKRVVAGWNSSGATLAVGAHSSQDQRALCRL